MAGLGRQVTGQTGLPIQASADGRPEWKLGGVTIDWTTVTAAGADTTLADGTIVKAGNKSILYGTPLVKVTNLPSLSITVDATAGTFKVTGAHPITGVVNTTAAIAFNAASATVQTALAVIYGAGNVAVSGGAGGPYTVTPAGNLISQVFPIFTCDSTLLTGNTHTATPAVVSSVSNYGYYGPGDTTAADGRQTVDATRRGEVFILNRTILQNPLLGGTGSMPSDFPGVIAGGAVWVGRLQVGGTNQITLANLYLAMPRLRPVEMF